MNDVVIDELRERDIPQAGSLAMRLFERFIAPDFAPDARAGIRQYLSMVAMRARLNARHFALAARVRVSGGQALAGFIEVRNHCHISLLFVDEPFQRRGIARQLVERALERCRAANPDLVKVSVHASPYAAPVYARLGFRPGPRSPDCAGPAVTMWLDMTAGPRAPAQPPGAADDAPERAG